MRDRSSRFFRSRRPSMGAWAATSTFMTFLETASSLEPSLRSRQAREITGGWEGQGAGESGKDSPADTARSDSVRPVRPSGAGLADPALRVLTADGHDLARHVRRVVAREEHDHVCDFPRLGGPPEGFPR